MRLSTIVTNESICRYIWKCCRNFGGYESEYDTSFDDECGEALKYNHSRIKLPLQLEVLLNFWWLWVWRWSTFWHECDDALKYNHAMIHLPLNLELLPTFWGLPVWTWSTFRHWMWTLWHSICWGSELLLLCMDRSVAASGSAAEILKAMRMNTTYV